MNDPLASTKKALLKDGKALAAYGTLIVETGAFRLPHDVLLGALLEAAEAFDSLDRDRMEGWRKSGERFRAARGGSSRGPRVLAGAGEEPGAPPAANAN